MGFSRTAEALLRGAGGRMVLLRTPQPAVAGDFGEQVGLATPVFQDAELGPAVLRKLRPRLGVGTSHVKTPEYELLVSGLAVEQIVGTLAFDSASVLFAQAAGVLLDGDLYTITSATGTEAFGAVLVWRLGLQAPAAIVL
jgi:hypothetical protein